MSVPLCPYPEWVLFLKLKLKVYTSPEISAEVTAPSSTLLSA